MAAERILGLTDNLMRKAPNALGEFVLGKIKYCLNGTHDWLENSCDRDHLCQFVVREGYKAEKIAKEVTKNLHSELSGRRDTIKQTREDAMRKGLASEVALLLQNPPPLGTVPKLFAELP